MIYGYCRISSKTQNIERQHRNILAAYPTAKIIDEVYTGKTFEGRKNLDNIINKVNEGDTIIFDSVSRFSRNSAEGFKAYEELYNRGIELVFLKEPHINTATYKKALDNNIQMTNTAVDSILKGINEYLMALAKEQIRIAFDQSQKEVDDLSQRTKEGIDTAKRNGKQIGHEKGTKLTTKKSLEAKEKILKHSTLFNGSMNDIELIDFCKISRNSFYKYKKEILEEKKIKGELK